MRSTLKARNVKFWVIPFTTFMRCVILFAMGKKWTKEQSGSLGGRSRWKKVSLKHRSEIMRAVALRRWKKV